MPHTYSQYVCRKCDHPLRNGDLLDLDAAEVGVTIHKFCPVDNADVCSPDAKERADRYIRKIVKGEEFFDKPADRSSNYGYVKPYTRIERR